MMRQILTAMLLIGLLPAATLAQEEEEAKKQEVDLGALIRQISRNMERIESNAARVQRDSAKAEGRAGEAETRERIERLNRRGAQVSEDIQKLIENLPRNGGGGGGGGSSQQQSSSSSSSSSQSQQDRSGARDRNRPSGQQGSSNQRPQGGRNPGEQDRGQRDGEGEGEGKQDQPRDRDGDGKPDGDGENRPGGRNSTGEEQTPPAGKPGVPPQLVERWGVLPPELRQRLVDRDFRRYTPQYDAAIRAYLRRLANPERTPPAPPRRER